MAHAPGVPSRQLGFTLIELITAIAVLSVVISLAMPSFRTLRLNGVRASAVNEMVVAFNYARSEAITRRGSVVVCRTADPAAQSPSCATGTGWESGWVSFVDTNANSEFDTGEDVLRRHEALVGGVTARGSGSAASVVAFSSNGMTAGNGKIAYCDSRGWSDDSRILSVAIGGRVRTLLKGQDALPNLTACS